MQLNELYLRSFRNYGEQKLEFDPGVNLIVGDNAQGKTNILEALYMCGTTKSHRGSKDKDMIWQCSNCGHIVVGKNAPEVCPVCNHPQAYFQVKAENYQSEQERVRFLQAVIVYTNLNVENKKATRKSGFLVIEVSK